MTDDEPGHPGCRRPASLHIEEGEAAGCTLVCADPALRPQRVASWST